VIETSAGVPPAVPVRGAAPDNRFVNYMQFAAVITALGYSLGYSTVGFGLLFFGTVWSLVAKRAVPWGRTALDLPLAGLGVVLVASAAASPHHSTAIGVTLMLLVSGAIYFGSFTWLVQAVPAVETTLLRSWAVGGAAAALAGILYSTVTLVRSGPGQFDHARAQVPHGVGPNGLGTTLLLASVLSLGGGLRARGWERIAWLACSAVDLVGLIATGSRASLVGWIVGSGYLIYRELRASPRAMLSTALLAALVAAGIVVETPQFAHRIRSTLSDVDSNRVQIWRTSLGMIRERPLLGTGFGTFEQAYSTHRAPGMSPEPFAFNLWLNLAVETGLLGLVAALWVGTMAVRHRRREYPGELLPRERLRERCFASTIAALWIGLLVDQLADNTLFSISTSAALWLLLVLTVTPSPSFRGCARTLSPRVERPCERGTRPNPPRAESSTSLPDDTVRARGLP
jgi:hypothetical protein